MRPQMFARVMDMPPHVKIGAAGGPIPGDSPTPSSALTVEPSAASSHAEERLMGNDV